VSQGRKHLTETGMAKGEDPDLPAYLTEPAASESGDGDMLEPHEERAEPGDLEPAVDDEQLDHHRSTRSQSD